MAIGCEEVSARMMDLLYGKVPADERATLEAHVVGCARCRAELDGFQATRAAARRTLDADAPPARAHQAIMRAAAAAVAAKEAQPIAARPVPARPSFWQRLRGRWTLPTFATVGAVAVVVLASKVFLEPQKTVELGRQTVHPTPAEAPAAPAEAPRPEAQKAAEAVAPEPKRGLLEDDLERAKQPATDKPASRATAAAEPARERKHVASGDAVGGLGFGKGSSAPMHHKATADLEGLLDGAGAVSAPKPSKREFAPPPPPRAERPSAPATAGASAASVDKDDGEMDTGPGRAGGGGPVQAGANAAPPPTQASAKAKKAAAPAEELRSLDRAAAAAPAAAPPPPASAPAPVEGQIEAKKLRGDAKTESRPADESPAARADRLYAEGHWSEAARAYRELLRRDPRNANAARWRQRLAAAEAAIAPETPAATAPASGQ
jgi:anti-sigma factor RsiW